MSINGKQYQRDMLQFTLKLIESLKICNLIVNHAYLLRGEAERDMQKRQSDKKFIGIAYKCLYKVLFVFKTCFLVFRIVLND